MKALPPGLQAHLASGVTTLAWCYALTRTDGQVLGFTDHDRALTFEGITFTPAAALSAGALEQTLGLGVDGLSVAGALTADVITEADLGAGRYDGAELRLWRVNWAAPDQRVLLRRGTLGEVRRGRTAFEAEIRGLAHVLNQPVGRVFALRCDADLGDARCGVDLESPAFGGTGIVSAIIEESRVVRIDGLGHFAPRWFEGGRFAALTGAAAGLSGEVKTHGLDGASAAIALWRGLGAPLSAGDQVKVTAGCDRSFAMCRTRFANATRFRGFPHMPGNDAAVAYPARGEPHDGGSRHG